MRRMGIGLAVIALAFAIGRTGIPGRAAAAAAEWLANHGHVTLAGPVGEVVRRVP